MNVRQYDGIGAVYEKFKTLPLARFPERSSFLRMVGDIRGASVIDLACGTGFYTRRLQRLGAAEVLGVDASKAMVAAARATETRRPLGVRYRVADAAELPGTGRRFDVATAVYLLNCADTPEEMERMCRGAHRSLVPGGTFFVLTQAPDFRFDGPSTTKYGFRYEPVGESAVGTKAVVTALLDPPVEYVVHHPRREVYEQSLKAAGFSAPEWVPLHVPEEGVWEFGEPYWADFLANPPLVMLRCRA